MNPESPDSTKPKHAPVRGKYAKAFEQGVRVIVHKPSGDESRQLRREKDGSFTWEPNPDRPNNANTTRPQFACTTKEHEFTLILTTDPAEEQADRLYSLVNDATLATVAGIPQLHFHREAPSLEQAISSAIKDVQSAGLEVARVEMEPAAVTQPT